MTLYKYSLEAHVGARWDDRRLREIESVDIRRLYAELRDRGLSRSSMRSVRSVLSALFATAAEDGLVERNPVGGVRVPASLDSDSDLQEPAKALTEEELRRLLGVLPQPWRLFFRFLTQTGLRISEAIALAWDDVALEDSPSISVRRQDSGGQLKRLKSNHARRRLPLSPAIAEDLLDVRPRARGTTAMPVFLTPAGTPVNRPNLASRVLKPAGERAGLTVERNGRQIAWPSFHTFRHTCASLLFQKNRNVQQVAEWLGHSDPAFTLRTYVHLLDDAVGDAGFFDEVLGTPKE
jgi:integrase